MVENKNDLNTQETQQDESHDTLGQDSRMGDGMTLGINLMVSVGLSAFAGYWLDQWLGTKGIFLIAFIILGFAAGMMQIWRAMNK